MYHLKRGSAAIQDWGLRDSTLLANPILGNNSDDLP